MLERDVEKYLIKRCKDEGILCEKFTSPQRRSVPDRILTHRGRIFFIELKATGQKPTESQARDHKKRAEYGAVIGWTDNTNGVDTIIKIIKCGGLLPDSMYVPF